ncbi:hypothetical protein QBC35DRAFT_118227 [Podospora australis]|uniref:Uncharacterized protein n=1 Tax=Podospora australis TaxID=1536484 RepID=A0AAN6WXY8_9PEZI|nr:hypothetical protein QBC35DRAFT_118227 [Podospora australis]
MIFPFLLFDSSCFFIIMIASHISGGITTYLSLSLPNVHTYTGWPYQHLGLEHNTLFCPCGVGGMDLDLCLRDWRVRERAWREKRWRERVVCGRHGRRVTRDG